MKEKILVSACLLGTPCRYDGRDNFCEKLQKQAEKYDLIAVCPEQLGGLCTPRTPAERRGSLVVTADGGDVTAAYADGAEKTLALAKKHGCRLAILKARSPSCGSGTIYDGTFSHTKIAGNGVTAELLQKNGVRVISEEDL